MNIFEKWTNSIWDFIEGKRLLEQANLPIESMFTFNTEMGLAEKAAFSEDDTTCDVASFKAPLWFVRAARKHFTVSNYRVSGCTNGKWIHVYDGVTKVEPWRYKVKSLDITVTVKVGETLVFFTAEA